MSRRQTYPDARAAAEACGAHILTLLEQSLAGRGAATLAVSGGSTPKPMFEFMARTPFDWSRVHVFWADERAVPPSHEQSNYRLVEEILLQPARIPPTNVHRVHGELAPEAAARRYVSDIRDYFRASELPRFDVVHLGMGDDGHTASLFPADPLIQNQDDVAAAVSAPKPPRERITLLPAALLTSRHIAVLVAGENKGPALRRVFSGPYRPLQCPAQIVARDTPQAVWFLDAAAARCLDG
jgi:6-phosphogluconolactonase